MWKIFEMKCNCYRNIDFMLEIFTVKSKCCQNTDFTEEMFVMKECNIFCHIRPILSKCTHDNVRAIFRANIGQHIINRNNIDPILLFLLGIEKRLAK